MRWEQLSWPEIDALDRDTPVVVPLGAVEQHGRHLPLGVDTLQVTAIADRVEAALAREVAVLPTLWLGSSHHHRDFPGTLSLRPSLYASVVKELVSVIAGHGFKRIFLLNGHGGNETPGSLALAELVAESDAADDVHLALASWWSVGRNAIKPDRHGLTTPFISHACEYETSLMLAIRGDLVHMDRVTEAAPVLETDFAGFEYGGKVAAFRRYHRLTASGSMGKPSAATREKGAAMLQAVADDVVRFLREFRTWPSLPVIRK